MHKVGVLVLIGVTGCGRMWYEPLASHDGDGGPDVPVPTDANAPTDGVPAADANGDAAGRLELLIVGRGAVTGPGGIACSDACAYDVAAAIQLTAEAAEGWQFDHLSPPCGTAPTCTVPPDTQLTATFVQPARTANLVFVTSTAATVTGLAAMDDFCNQTALSAGVTGTFVAFLSTSTVDARDRLAGARGWVRFDGLPVFDEPTTLNDPLLPRPVAFDESGASSNVFVMTGSTADGRRMTGNCTDWTGEGVAYGGHAELATPQNIAGIYSDCASPVYCFQTDHNVAVDLHPAPFPTGRYVFVTESTFDPSTGLAAADARCQTDAIAAGLPGTYRAVLATTTESVTDRVGSLAGAWRRPDGLVVTFDGLDQQPWLAVISLTATGASTGDAFVFLGAPDLSQPAPAGFSCGDWTQASGGAYYAKPYSGEAFDTTFRYSNACSASYRLACVQL